VLKPKSPQTPFYGSHLYDRVVPADQIQVDASVRD
jgi:hypothetical protein